MNICLNYYLGFISNYVYTIQHFYKRKLVAYILEKCIDFVIRIQIIKIFLSTISNTSNIINESCNNLI